MTNKKNTRSLAFNYMQHEGSAGLCRACGVKERIGTRVDVIPLKASSRSESGDKAAVVSK